MADVSLAVPCHLISSATHLQPLMSSSSLSSGVRRSGGSGISGRASRSHLHSRHLRSECQAAGLARTHTHTQMSKLAQSF